MKSNKTWKHDELAEDLAVAKGGIPFLNVCLGSAWLKKRGEKTPRADLLMCRPSYKRFIISIFEIKVTRSDFLSDIRSAKWREYLNHCDRFYFATLKDIVSVEDIPSEAGLVLRGEKGWYTKKPSPMTGTVIDTNTLKSIIFAKQRRSAREKRLDDIQDMRDYWRRYDFNGRLKAARVLGNKVGSLHEAAMKIGGIDEAIDVLKTQSKIRFKRGF